MVTRSKKAYENRASQNTRWFANQVDNFRLC